ALGLYGIGEDQYSNDEDMFTLMHEMRSRIMRAPAFQGDKVIGAILFENTMDRSVDGIPAADYLWEKRGVVPFLKVDKGLADIENDAQILKPMPELDTLLMRAKKANIFGTKMRSVIHRANRSGIEAVVAQQFDIARQILAHGLIPIIEPEVNIHAEDKQAAEDLLLECLKIHLDKLDDGAQVMLKLTLPEKNNHYHGLAEHPRVMRVVALSGGYSREEANLRLAQNKNMIASFSRALTEGLNANQSDAEFQRILGQTIDAISTASASG
ncbi:MAG: fructose bisphosphate aldolase, partial [Rhodobacteraceae bacterium]|nr:fructose bisphosphate aldolase [Paracoccaceae bacterium]